jgi:hypothetical protein
MAERISPTFHRMMDELVIKGDGPKCVKRDCNHPYDERWHARMAQYLMDTKGPMAAADFEVEHLMLREGEE